MSRGFVTIATGKQNYYQIAENLLLSYKLHCANPMPFAVICDRQNQFTSSFDQVIIIDQPTCSYLDKLALPELVPYDETIFIDADCLAYDDLNDFWIAFQGASDFSAFGYDYPPNYSYAWFKRENAGKYRDSISSIPDFIGGVYYLKKSAELNNFSRTCTYVLNHYRDFTFRQFSEPADEPVFALAMAVHGFKTAGERSLPVCFYPHATHFEAFLPSGRVIFDDIYKKDSGVMEGAYLVHWGTGNTSRPCYLCQKYQLKRAFADHAPGKIESFVSTLGIWVLWFMRKAAGKARRFHGLF